MHTPEFLAARHAAMLAQNGFEGLDDLDPKGPCGHAYGLRVSSRLTTVYRQRLQRGIVDVRPEDVIQCMIDAKIENWVLMGLHGYVGYLADPRATQDVDVMVPYSQKARTANAIGQRWPMLKRVELSQIVRFMDTTDLYSDGSPKPVVDVMLAWSKFQETILEKHIVVDKATGSRYPTLEAALVSKYSAIVSPHRTTEKKEYDAGDFRRIVLHNKNDINRILLRELRNQVWEQGGDEVIRFVDLTLSNQPLPV